MEQYDINGVSVKFPFDPYPVQRKYMEKVIESIENKQNALLESPTGVLIQTKSKYYCSHARMVT